MSKVQEIANIGNSNPPLRTRRRKKRSRKKSYGVLPTKLVVEIKRVVPTHLHPYALRIVQSIYSVCTSKRNDFSLLDYNPFALNFFSTTLGTRATYAIDRRGEKYEVGLAAMKYLIQGGILQVLDLGGYTYLSPTDPRLKPGQKPFCQKMRINPDLLRGKPTTFELKFINDRKLNEIENFVRMCLEDIILPFSNDDEIYEWVCKLMQQDVMLKRITDRITEFNSTNENDLPKFAHLLSLDPESGKYKTEVIEKEFILANLLPGQKLLIYTPKAGKSTYYIAQPDELLNWKLEILISSFSCQLSILNQVRITGTMPNFNGTNDRLDHILTNTFSKFIALCIVNDNKGKPNSLNGIDMCNSQFTFFAAILSECLQLIDEPRFCDFLTFFYNKFLTPSLFKEKFKPVSYSKKLKTLFKSLNNTYRLINNLHPHILHILLPLLYHIQVVTNCKSGEKLCVKIEPKLTVRNELEKFIRLSGDGELYESIAAKRYFKKEFSELTPESVELIREKHRSGVKDSCFALLFDKHNAHHFKEDRKASRAILSDVFPDALNIVDVIKKSCVSFLKRQQKENPELYDKLYFKKKKSQVETPTHLGNAAFSTMLAQIESMVMINGVLRKVIRTFWATSKHDSILCLASEYDRVLKVVHRELDRFLGAGNYQLKKQSWAYAANTMDITITEEKI
ncbi:MAG: hypothetical protein R2824_06160 [Saprospiraceae bacterium]|nr:hypothetical protein [Lewinella sp.]